MNQLEVLLDLFQVYKDGIHTSVKDISPEAWVWQPDSEANNIAVTIWHITRIMDMFITRRLEGKDAANEIWVRDWASKTGYDPRGLGTSGNGVLIGYTMDDVKKVPTLTAAEMLIYFDTTLEAFVNLLRTVDLNTQAPGGEIKRTYYEWARIAMLDGIRHTGEIFAIRAMWNRKFAK